MAKYFLLLPALTIFYATSVAQTSQRDTAFVATAVENTKNMYLKVIQEQIQLYNGGDYVDYRSQNDEHPYFISEDWITGSIQYDRQQYDDISLLYNIYTDQVIIEQSSSTIMVQLIRDKVQTFSLNGHQFIMLEIKDLPKGFYDQLCNGKVNVFAKRIKNFQETISSSQIHRDFIEKSRYYISKDGHYYQVKSKKSVLNVLSDRKRDLNQFIRQNHLRFRKNREAAIIKLAEFYNRN